MPLTKQDFALIEMHFAGDHEDDLTDGCMACEFEAENMLRGKPERPPYEDVVSVSTSSIERMAAVRKALSENGLDYVGPLKTEHNYDRDGGAFNHTATFVPQLPVRDRINFAGLTVKHDDEQDDPAEHEYIAVYAKSLAELAHTLSKVSKDGYEPVGNPLFRDYEMDRRRYEILIRRPMK